MTFIVTGGGTGIGRALSLQLAERGHKVLICGRRQTKLAETVDYFPALIQYVEGDLTHESIQQALFDALDEQPLQGLIQCAAQLKPLAFVESLSLDAYRSHQKINVETPIALFQLFRKRLSGARVLHISSLAAHRAFPGWAAYCMSKSSLFMLYQLLKKECPDIAFGSVMPGITDTAMQASIRQSTTLRNEDKAFFENLYQKDTLLKAEVVGQFLIWLLLNVKPEVFSEKEWDIYDTSHHEKWLKTGEVSPL